MEFTKIGRRGALGLLGTLAGTGSALAHHGWSWAEGEQGTLTGTVREIYVGPPHPTLRVEANGQIWTVELGNPNQTARAGFTETSLRPGQEIVALGNRSRDSSERRLKAVRVTAGNRRFDFYPERIQGG
ncbi:DUF6152 family protein [Falsiroseomonas sp.]|uniref:DUF6152 family protein n=1 Tax=Falsiroseomonas sp. TaxID=2870721 RepID=UPI003F6FCD33